MRQHFLDMGVIPGAELTLIKSAPMGDPIEVRIHGYQLTLRLDDAAKIEVEPAESSSFGMSGSKSSAIEHPGLGEMGKYHVKEDEDPLPKGSLISFALAGNQNSGKTTLFNQLTGSNQHVGNFPGVTVDRKSGPIKGYDNTLITDLPGIYSLSPYTSEELVSRQFILDEKPNGIIDILDATSISRGLYLTMQLMELDVPMVLALNMMDELEGNGGSVDVNLMESMLGIPVVPISAMKNQGVHELVSHAVHVANFQEKPGRLDFCAKDEAGGAVHRCLHALIHLIEDHAENAGIPVRFAATKLAEGDERVLEALGLTQNEKETVEHIVLQMEEERGMDRAAAIADMRYSFIRKLVESCVVMPRESRERKRSAEADRILTGKYTAIPVFVAIMGLVFYLTFGVIGSGLQDLLEKLIGGAARAADAAMSSAGVSEVLRSLISDGIFAGVGSVLSFLPIIVTLFFFLSLLEDTGYMARIAFVMDRLLRKVGLSGRSIVPLLIGFGCTVPGVMASRTMPSERDRRMTIMLTPYMSCTAKLPIWGFFAAAFFPGSAAAVIVIIYFLGILVGILAAMFLNRFVYKGDAVPFVMELPNYRMPSPKSVGLLLWEKARDFIQRAFTIIFVATLLIWFLQSFGTDLRLTDDPSSSILALLGSFIAPVFKPLGFGDWRCATAVVTGLAAKESVVATLTVLFGSEAGFSSVLSIPAACAMAVFCLLYPPCVAAMAAIKNELGAKRAGLIIAAQCLVAWCIALIVRLTAGLF